MNLDKTTSENILINLSFLLAEPTGISVYASQVIPHLAPLKPTLLTAQNYDNFNCYQIPANLTPAQGTKGHFQRLLWTQNQLPKIYRQLKADLLFSPIPEAPIFSDFRSIVMVHDLIPLRFPRSTSALTLYFRVSLPTILKQAQHIICNSQATADDLVSMLNVPASKITPILLGYNQQHFRLLNNLSPQPKNPYFLYLGRHDPHKNLSRLISAFAQLSQPQNYQLWLAGPSDRRYTPKLIAQAKELGIESQVKCLDYVPFFQLPMIINQALAMVFPSLWEGFGFPVLEAMACGTPVITSNLSSLPEVAENAALLVNPYNISAIAEAMQRITIDSQLRSQLSQRGLARAKILTWERTGQETLSVLQQFL